MSVNASVLRELHRIHLQLADLKDRLERGQRQVKARQGAVAKMEQELAQASASSKATQMVTDQKQLSLKSIEAKTKELQRKLNEAQNNREYQALLEQIAADRMAASVLSDEILESLEKVDSSKANVTQATQNLQSAKQELEKAQKSSNDSHQLIESEIARVQAELHEVEKRLPDDFRESYERASKTRGAETLAKADGGCCGGCFSTLTPNQNNLLRMDKLVVCNSCGRVMYLPEIAH